MKYVFVDRSGATAIWGLINPIATALVAERNQVVYCNFNDGRKVEGPSAPQGVSVIDIHVRRKTHVWDLCRQAHEFGSQFRRTLRECRPDVVHSHFCVPGVVARHVARQEGVPHIVSTQHETYGSMFPHFRWAVRFAERCSNATVYVSKAVADSFGRRLLPIEYPRGETPLHVVIHNGIDLPTIDVLRDRVVAKDPLKIVISGRLVERKGHDTLIRAMPQVVRCFPGVQLVVVGTGTKEPALRRLAKELGLERSIRFAGWLRHESAVQEVAGAAAAIAPSTAEGFGLVVAEAMACRTPVIASDIQVFREIAGEDDRIYFFRTADSGSLAARICQVLADPLQASERAELARERVERCFSMNRMVGKYLNLYKQLASQRLETNRV